MRYLLPLLCFLFGCQTQPDLIGHWHASTVHHDSNGFPNEEHYTFDILNDTLAAMRSRPPFWNGLLCTIDGEAQQISRHMGCLSFDWNYKIISENELAITDSYHKGDKAIKLLRKSGCDIETHLFMDAKLNIVLPETTINGIKSDDQSALQRHYCIGPASKKYASFYSKPFHYQLGDKIDAADSFSLALYEEKHLIKLPEAKRHLTKAIIFANAKTPANSLNNLLTYTCGRGNEMLYFATLQRSPDTTILWYQPVEVRSATAPEELTIAKWLGHQEMNR